MKTKPHLFLAGLLLFLSTGQESTACATNYTATYTSIQERINRLASASLALLSEAHVKIPKLTFSELDLTTLVKDNTVTVRRRVMFSLPIDAANNVKYFLYKNKQYAPNEIVRLVSDIDKNGDSVCLVYSGLEGEVSHDYEVNPIVKKMLEAKKSLKISGYIVLNEGNIPSKPDASAATLGFENLDKEISGIVDNLLKRLDKLKFTPLIPLEEGPLHGVLDGAGVNHVGGGFNDNKMECIVHLFVNGGNHRRLLELAWVKSKDRQTRVLILLLFYTNVNMHICGMPSFEHYDLFNKEETQKRHQELQWVKGNAKKIRPKMNENLWRIDGRRDHSTN